MARFWRRRGTQTRTTQEEHVVAPPRSRPIWPWLLLLLLLVLGGLAAAWYFTTREETVEADQVPSVVGLRRDAAEDRLSDRGFESEFKRLVSPRPSGTVVAQRPAAGTLYGKGGIVVVSVAGDPLKVEVPDLTGLASARALARLRTLGLEPRPQMVSSPRPQGQVVRQIPEPGTEVPRGSPAVVFVSGGRQLVSVPDVGGLPTDDATSRLTAAGFRTEVNRVPGAEPDGTVIDQRPAAQTRAPRGSVVRIDVSIGPGETSTTVVTTTATNPAQRVAVPDTVGQDEATATATLEGAGFVVRRRTRAAPDPTQDGIVVEQTPAGGTTARSGSQVTIFVGIVR
jgi:eukaryotic-like serine/threonine-protein kinase